MNRLNKDNNFFKLFDKNNGILSKENLDFVKNFIDDTKIEPENHTALIVLNLNFYLFSALYYLLNFL